MKKILFITTTILLILSLSACYKPEVDNHISDVVNKINLPSEVSTSFDLLLAKENVSLSWQSSNDAIKIQNSRAVVTQSSVDVNVTLTLNAKRNDVTVSKDFNVNVLKIVVENPDYPIYTIEETFELGTGEKVKLENVTVADTSARGTHFTDGEYVIYAYGCTGLSVGSTYEVIATKTTYGEGVNMAQQITVVNSTLLEEEAQIIEPVAATIEELITETNFSYYNTTGVITKEGETLFIKDGDFKVEVSSYNNTESTELLNLFIDEEVTLNIYITGGKANRTILTYVDESTIKASDSTFANVASNSLSVATSVVSNMVLPTTGEFNTTISWTSSNNDVLSSEGIVNRLEQDTIVTLTAIVTLNNISVTKTFEVTVVNSLQIELESLFISEYYEGKSYDKYIEIYNPNDTEVNLVGYSIKLAIDGANFTLELKLTGTLQANEVIVVASNDSRLNSLISDAVTSLGTNGIFDAIPYRINGNDTVGLFYDDELVDVFGVVGENPGSKWNLNDGGSTVDHRIIRNKEFGANPIWDTSEWTSTSISAAGQHLDDLGKHTYIGGSV